MEHDAQPALRWEWREDSGKLLAHFDPLGLPCLLDPESLVAAMIAAGHGSLHRNEEALARFAGMARDAQQPFFLEVAERRDGRCEVMLADDQMKAWLNIQPPAGGRPADRAMVEAALAQRGVISGLLEDEIAAAIAEGHCERRLVARGRPPQPGEPARFTSLLPSAQPRGPALNARGRADYREVGSLLIVHAGDALMRRVPATPGVAGEDVLGMPIPATAGKDLPFAAGLQGAAPDAEDPNLLRATRTGQPVLRADGVEVEPTITLPAVDLVSGNVDFDGTVNITGDVAPGMRIHASGDVFIGGTVEAAEIAAGGNVSVRGGAIGHADRHVGALPTRIRAMGNVSVRFCENAFIDAQGSIQIDEVAVHSELLAQHDIVVGNPKARRSQIIGGTARAGISLRAAVLGSPAGVRTRLQAGYNPALQAEVSALRQALQQNAQQQADLRKILDFAGDGGPRNLAEVKEKAARTLEASQQAAEPLQARLAELEETMSLSEHAQVAVSQGIHPGVEVQLGNASWKNNDTLGKGVLRMHEDRVEFVAG